MKSRSAMVPWISLIWATLVTITAAAEDDGSSEPREWPNGGPDVTKFTYVEENGLTKIGLLPQAPPDNMRNSEGDFIKLKDGRILLAYCHFTGGYGDHATAHLAGRFSSDKGKHWTKEDVVILPNEGGMNVMCPSLLRLQNGQIALFYLRKDSPRNCHLYMRTSSDEAKTWSKPTCCMPDAPGYFGGRATPLHAAISRDEGLTWENVKVIEDDPEGWYVYPAICFVGDRVLLTYCAGNHPYHMAKSQVTVFDVDWLYEK